MIIGWRSDMIIGYIVPVPVTCVPNGGDVRTHRYRITILGGLGQTSREAFGDFHIEPNGTDTVLIADLDQSGLYGALNRIQSLGLELIELSRLPSPA
jgi:hypothetical protein